MLTNWWVAFYEQGHDRTKYRNKIVQRSDGGDSSNAFQFHDVMWQREVRGIDCQYFDMYNITMWWIIENVLDTRSKQSRRDLSIIDFFTALFILFFHDKNVMEGGSFLS